MLMTTSFSVLMFSVESHSPIKVRSELAKVRKEYEMLRIDFEQNFAGNVQTGPINKN